MRPPVCPPVAAPVRAGALTASLLTTGAQPTAALTACALPALAQPARRALLLGAAAAAAARWHPGRAADAPPPADDPAARQLVARADEVRLPRDDFQVEVTVTSTLGGQAQEPRRYRVLSKGTENTVILTLEPSAERGQNLLLKGRDLWVFMPSVSQPVRLSLSQRLTGQVANGDLARANFSADYSASRIGVETIDTREHQVFELRALERSVTYAKVNYVVRSDNAYPQRAEFFSVSGRLLKTCRYEKFEPLGGRIRPTRLVISDALKPGDESVLEYSGMKLAPLADRLFTKDFLKKFD